MIQIHQSVLRRQKNFWNNCLFHPTDAVEDPWGRRILDRMAADRSIHTVRIYTMFEDIVYLDEDGGLCYDFRLSDLRLDYLVEKGYCLLLAYAGMPDCIAASTASKSSVSKNKTRYKGKMWNTSAPKDYALWEEVCYEYTKHLVDRYGIETVSKWRMQCFNEADIPDFFLGEYPHTLEATLQYRLPAYCRLYAAFEKGIRRVSDSIRIGGPALAMYHEFLGGWLDYVKQNGLKLDFISVHNYGTDPYGLNSGTKPISVQNNLIKQRTLTEIVCRHGFTETPLVIDEWGFSTAGFFNREECPALMHRETEVFSAYFARLIHDFIYSDFKLDLLCICLSGQHEMTEDFSGFRNFFTLNFIAKPIYNAYLLASMLGESLLDCRTENDSLFVIPTRTDDGSYSILLSYSSEHFEEDIPSLEETLSFDESIAGKTVTIRRIDSETANPYRLYQKMGIDAPAEEDLTLLREEGRIKPVCTYTADGEQAIPLTLTANSVYLITITQNG